ncbi:hypothetical protein BH20ACT2_BH20ACT2_02600 [soil metagenome]
MGTDKRERQKAGRQVRLDEARAAQKAAARRRRIFSALVVVALVVGIGLVISLLSGDDDQSVTSDDTTDSTDSTDTTAPEESAIPEPPGAGASITGETPCPPADGSAERTTSFEQLPPTCIDPDASYTATFATSAGDVTVALDTEQTPVTTNNFVVLARYHYYDDTALFRTDPSIDIIQGGAPTTNDNSDPGAGYDLPDEGGEFDFSDPAAPTGPFTYEPGQLIMARSQGPDSSGSQFFFSTGPNVSNLDAQGTYLLFGEVTEGLEVLEEILASHQADTTGRIPGGSPSPPVILESVTITES